MGYLRTAKRADRLCVNSDVVVRLEPEMLEAGCGVDDSLEELSV